MTVSHETEARFQRIRRLRKIAKRNGLAGMARSLETAGHLTILGERDSADAYLASIVRDIDAGRAWVAHMKGKDQ